MSNFDSTVYGPVNSWRFGQSIGVDPILTQSTCSYSCSYCQLGKIQKHTDQVQEFQKTERVIEDFKKCFDKKVSVDVITFSGSGEPTLASNLEEMASEIRKLVPHIPQVLLTNGLHLKHPAHTHQLQDFDHIVLKIDAVEKKYWQFINHPLAKSSLEESLESMISFAQDHPAHIEVQTMIYSLNQDMDLEKYCEYMEKIDPTKIYINAPSRKYPLQWELSHRGNHTGQYDVKTASLKAIDLRDYKEKIIKISREIGNKVKLCPHDLL